MSDAAPVTVCRRAATLHTGIVILYHIHERHAPQHPLWQSHWYVCRDFNDQCHWQKQYKWRTPLTKTWRTWQCGVTANRMVQYAEKTKVMIIATQQRWQHLKKKEPDLFNRDQKHKVVQCDRLLGLQLDHSVSWSVHIKKIHRTISGYHALLWRIKDCLLHQTRLTFYNCYILPHLDYCSTIWGNATASETHKLHNYSPETHFQDRLWTSGIQHSPDAAAALASLATTHPIPLDSNGLQSCKGTCPRLHVLHVSSSVFGQQEHPVQLSGGPLSAWEPHKSQEAPLPALCQNMEQSWNVYRLRQCKTLQALKPCIDSAFDQQYKNTLRLTLHHWL